MGGVEKAALWPRRRCNVKTTCGGRLPGLTYAAMSKGDMEREKRLAEALRANLRRRKQQVRRTSSADDAGGDGDRNRDGDDHA